MAAPKGTTKQLFLAPWQDMWAHPRVSLIIYGITALGALLTAAAYQFQKLPQHDLGMGLMLMIFVIWSYAALHNFSFDNKAMAARRMGRGIVHYILFAVVTIAWLAFINIVLFATAQALGIQMGITFAQPAESVSAVSAIIFLLFALGLVLAFLYFVTRLVYWLPASVAGDKINLKLLWALASGWITAPSLAMLPIIFLYVVSVMALGAIPVYELGLNQYVEIASRGEALPSRFSAVIILGMWLLSACMVVNIASILAHAYHRACADKPDIAALLAPNGEEKHQELL